MLKLVILLILNFNSAIIAYRSGEQKIDRPLFLATDSLCIRNKISRNEYLYPSTNYYQKYADPYQPDVSGRALIGVKGDNTQHIYRWSIKPVRQVTSINNNKQNVTVMGVYKIYNNGYGGYLNALNNLKSSQHRDVFVEKEGDGDNWKIEKISSYEFTIKNYRTNEYLYSLPNRKYRKLLYPGESGKPIYTFDYGYKDLNNSAIWIIKKNCDSVESKNQLGIFANRKDLCFENKHEENMFLVPSPNYHQKYSSLGKPKYLGRAFAGEPNHLSEHYNKWSLILVSEVDDTYKIYNHGFNGYLNSIIKVRSDNRDVFLEKDSEGDNWIFRKLSKDEFSIQNEGTSEYLHTISDRSFRNFFFPDESGMPIYTYNYAHGKVDSLGTWILRTDC